MYITIKFYKDTIASDYVSGTIDEVSKSLKWIGNKYTHIKIEVIGDSVDQMESLQALLDSIKLTLKEK